MQHFGASKDRDDKGPVEKRFGFDHVLDGEATQADVWEHCSALVEATPRGFNATVLAYGMTGSGKTHTMGTAPGMSDGVVPSALRRLFSTRSVRGGEVRVSFVEIYQDQITDLLSADRARVAIRVDTSTGGVRLEGEQRRRVASEAEALALLDEGARNRATAATHMNEASSRSHAVFTVSLLLRPGAQGEGEGEGSSGGAGAATAELSPKLHFVDLAGSERAAQTGATTGVRA